MNVISTVEFHLMHRGHLHQSKLDVLVWMFNAGSGSTWIDGELGHPESQLDLIKRHASQRSPSDRIYSVEADNAKLAKEQDLPLSDAQELIHEILGWRKRKAEVVWRQQNARLLASLIGVSEWNQLSRAPVDHWYERLFDMPLHVAPDWKAAGIELAEAVVQMSKAKEIPIMDGTQHRIDEIRDGLKVSAANATRFLDACRSNSK